jgi:thiol-disulfide isomerase/thioredoxin
LAHQDKTFEQPSAFNKPNPENETTSFHTHTLIPQTIFGGVM